MKRVVAAGLMSMMLLIVGCTTAPPPAPGEQPPPPTGQAPPAEAGRPSELARPAEPPGWRYILTTGEELRLVSSNPDGTAFFMTSNLIGGPRQDLLVSVGERLTIAKLTSRQVVTATPAHWRADFIDLPWGTVALEAGSDRGNEGGAISPVKRYAVVSGDGLWLADLQTGAARLATSPRPEQWPPGMDARNPLIWAGDPRWSADSKWIYFTSNRQPPHTMAWWRVSVDGGPEEPADAPPSREQYAKQLQGDGFYFGGLSPDGKWAVTYNSESPTFRLHNLEQPSASLAYTHTTGWYAGAWDSWSPDSSKVLFHARPQHDLAGFLGVYDVRSGGKASLYAFPDPLAGRPVAVGFIGNDQVLVSMQPWNDDYSDRHWPAETQWWLLDLKTVPPLAPAEPTRILAARLMSPPYWRQSGKVTGGETALTLDGPVGLRFDRPVSPDWLKVNVVIEGSGADLETDGALLGLATVRIRAGTPGQNVRVRVPKLGFDLLVRRMAHLSVKVEVRQGESPWVELNPHRIWLRKPLDLRFTFSRPVDEKAVVRALAQGANPPEGRGYRVTPTGVRWEDGALVMHVAEPVPVLVFSLSEVHDEYGLRPVEMLHKLWTGTPPALVAAAAAGKADELLAEVPVEISEAVISPNGTQLWFSAAHLGFFGARDPGGHWALDLATCESVDLGPGLPVGWDPQGRPLLIRWADSRDRAGDRRYIQW